MLFLGVKVTKDVMGFLAFFLTTGVFSAFGSTARSLGKLALMAGPLWPRFD
jgi:hypothetical protein